MKRFLHIFLLLLFLLIVFESCKRTWRCRHEEEETGIIVSKFDFGECFTDVRLHLDDEYIITEDSSYQLLKPILGNPNIEACENLKLTEIDFSKYTLLSKKTERSCENYIKRDVRRDDAEKKYVYTIEMQECLFCKKTGIMMNWILVPQLPPGYTVEFIVNNVSE